MLAAQQSIFLNAHKEPHPGIFGTKLLWNIKKIFHLSGIQCFIFKMGVGGIIIPILQMMKVRYREVRKLLKVKVKYLVKGNPGIKPKCVCPDS